MQDSVESASTCALLFNFLMYSITDFSKKRSSLSDTVVLQTTSYQYQARQPIGLGSSMAEKTGRVRKLVKLFNTRGRSISFEEDPPQDDFPPGNNKIR